MFKGFISRAKSICSPKYLKQEIEFLINIFVENGYDKKSLEKIVENSYKPKPQFNRNNKFTSLPWIPGLSQKLKKSFKKAGCQLTFKSPRNLNYILTSKNKPQLPPNSWPGVYLIPCNCKSRYTGETKNRVCKRTNQHNKAVFTGETDKSALAEHDQQCNQEINWDNVKTLAIEPTYLRRKVRESLEIRRYKTGPDDIYGLNKDYGQYVKTNAWQTLFDSIDVLNIKISSDNAEGDNGMTSTSVDNNSIVST